MYIDGLTKIRMEEDFYIYIYISIKITFSGGEGGTCPNPQTSRSCS